MSHRASCGIQEAPGLLHDHHGRAATTIPFAFRVVDRIIAAKDLLIELRVLELSLGQDVLEVLVKGAALAVIFPRRRLLVVEALRLVHEGLAVVALRVLLHGHHRQVRLYFDCAPGLRLGRFPLRCGRHWRQTWLILNLANAATTIWTSCQAVPHRMHLLHGLVVVLFVRVSHRLVQDRGVVRNRIVVIVHVHGVVNVAAHLVGLLSAL